VRQTDKSAEFAMNEICKERGWKLQGKENARKGPKIRIRVKLQRMDFARNAYAYIAYRRDCVVSITDLLAAVFGLLYVRVITSAKEVMFLSDFVCLSVCLCVNKITRKVMDGSF